MGAENACPSVSSKTPEYARVIVSKSFGQNCQHIYSPLPGYPAAACITGEIADTHLIAHSILAALGTKTVHGWSVGRG